MPRLLSLIQLSAPELVIRYGEQLWRLVTADNTRPITESIKQYHKIRHTSAIHWSSPEKPKTSVEDLPPKQH